MFVMRCLINRLLLAACLFASLGCTSVRVVKLADYLTPASETDAMPAIRAALQDCREKGATRLELPEGVLNIKTDQAYEAYQFISNNDESLKRIAFLLDGMHDFEIVGNSTKLLFTGFISPFSLRNCRNVAISGFSIDYTRTFNSQGEIVGGGKDFLDLRFPDEYVCRLENGCLVFYDRDWTRYPFSTLLEFDTEKREPAQGASDNWLYGGTVRAEQLRDHVYRIFRENLKGTVGNTLVLGARARYNPAIFLSECEKITIHDVTINHCGGMGVIAQMSRDIELRALTIEPSGGRMVSITADATHFVNCKGEIKMTDCKFRNQMDDHTNIHGLYMVVDKVLGPRKLLLSWHNTGQYGLQFLKKGLEVEIVDNRTLQQITRAVVDNVIYLNKVACEVEFSEDLPEGVGKDMVIADDSGYPDVLISGCDFRNNRARGLLLGSRGRIVVENNYFHIPGTAILFEGDGNFWFEQSGVRNVELRNNVFENGNFGYSNWGAACIYVGSRIPDKSGKEAYHRNISVTNNTFRVFDPRILNISSVDGLVFSGNTIEKTTDYPDMGNSGKPFVVSAECKNIKIEE